MDEEKKWMLITYYCPTHGDPSMVEQIEITRNEMNEKILKRAKTSKN